MAQRLLIGTLLVACLFMGHASEARQLLQSTTAAKTFQSKPTKVQTNTASNQGPKLGGRHLLQAAGPAQPTKGAAQQKPNAKIQANTPPKPRTTLPGRLLLEASRDLLQQQWNTQQQVNNQNTPKPAQAPCAPTQTRVDKGTGKVIPVICGTGSGRHLLQTPSANKPITNAAPKKNQQQVNTAPKDKKKVQGRHLLQTVRPATAANTKAPTNTRQRKQTANVPKTQG